MIEIKIKSLEEIDIAAKEFVKNIGDERIFAFYGEMGAGKTTFIKAICKEMQVEDEITSPTFAIVNEYFSEIYGKIFHFDFYRINKINEVYDLGFSEYINSGAFIFMEWSENIDHILPEGITKVTVTQDDKGERTVTLKKC